MKPGVTMRVHGDNNQAARALEAAADHAGTGGDMGAAGGGWLGAFGRTRALVVARLDGWLVANWRQAPRMVSMWAYFATICLLLGVLYAVLTTGERLSLSYGDMVRGLLALLALQFIGAVGRMIQQPGLVDDLAAVLGDADD